MRLNLDFQLSCMRLFSRVALLLLVLAGSSIAQDVSEEKFEADSLKFRTVLHYQPLAGTQLDLLVGLYEKAGRIDELIGLYQGHVAQYPDDIGAKIVLLRLLENQQRPELDEQLNSFVAQHPESAALQYLLFQSLESKGDARASEVLSGAITLETDVARRESWLEELLKRAQDEGERELAKGHLETTLGYEDQTDESLLQLANKMQRYRYWDLSLQALEKVSAEKLSPDAQVEREVLAARAEASLQKTKQAGDRLDALLDKLAIDYWRRGEILAQRIEVVATEEERAAMLAGAKEKFESEGTEIAALNYAEFLSAAQRKKAAVQVLIEGLEKSPNSSVLENRALMLLDQMGDFEGLERFLEARLELDPSRLPLRYELVKVSYRLGKTAEAEQDFTLVLGALEEGEANSRQLDLARFVKALDQPANAAKHYKAFLKASPERLDIARELGEIYLEYDDRKAATELLRGLSANGAALENLVDLVQFEIDEKFYPEARALLSGALREDPEQFELGLMLVRVLSDSGDQPGGTEWIEKTRKLADTEVRYLQWVKGALAAHRSFGTMDQFFDSEQNRYSFAEGDWTEARLARFLILCEEGEQAALGSRVTAAIRNQLTSAKLDDSGALRLRRLLVKSLGNNPEKAEEIEEQLSLLSESDPDNRGLYDLQLAVMYHRSGRIDLARELFASLSPEAVSDLKLLRESVPLLLEFEQEEKAASVLASITEREPRDILSWEARLSLLAGLSREQDFRAAARELLDPNSSLQLRESSKQALQMHLLDSHWRSIARLLARGDADSMTEVLPLLELVDEESTDANDRMWSSWTRSYVLRSLGRSAEAKEAAGNLRELMSQSDQDEIVFPDGLAVGSQNALSLLDNVEQIEQEAVDPVLFSNEPEIAWAFEVDEGARVLRQFPTAYGLLILDNRGTVYRVESETGKLIWKENLGLPEEVAFRTGSEPGGAEDQRVNARRVRPMLANDKYFYLVSGSILSCYSSGNCSLVWQADLNVSLDGKFGEGSGALPQVDLALSKDRLIVSEPLTGKVFAFHSDNGKLLWDRQLERKASDTRKQVVSLNSGLSLAGKHVFVFSQTAEVLDLETGESVWSFVRKSVNRFPIKLRESKEEDQEAEPVLLGATRKASQWQKRSDEAQDAKPVAFLDYMDNSGGQDSRFLNYPVSLVAPAVNWSESRTASGVVSDAVLGRDFVWLMGDRNLRRVSLRLPLSSENVEVEGSFLGRKGEHVWFLSGTDLLHANFQTNEVSRISVSDLGEAANIRGSLEGAQLVLTGENGVRIYQAVTGNSVGVWSWGESFREHLVSRLGEDRPESQSVWQGVIQTFSETGAPFCYPVINSSKDGTCFTVFGQRMVVAVKNKEEKTEPPAETPEN